VLKREAERKARVDFEERVIETVVDIAQVEFPPILVDVEVERLIDQQLERWQLNRDNLEAYLQRIKKTEAELREELKPLAEKRVTRSLVLGKVAEDEKIEVSASEIDGEIQNMTQSETEKRDELKKSLNTPQVRNSIKEILLARKTIERLVEIARGPVAETETKRRTKRKSKVKEEEK